MDVKTMLRLEIEKAAQKAAAENLFAGQLPAVFLEEPPQKEFGDYATNFAMQAAKSLKKNPKLIAEAIIARLDAPFIKKAVLAGPGFINFYLTPAWLGDEMKNILTQGERYGEGKEPLGKVQVEFVSANPTGPLHVGHGRGAAVGSALVNLLRAAGYDAQAEFYINDAGNQMDNLAASVEARYLELFGQKVEFPADGYWGQDIIVTAQQIKDRDGAKYLDLPQTERLALFKELALQEKLAALQNDLQAFGVEFDVWFSERQLYKNNALNETVAALQKDGHIYEKDGALWLKSTVYGDDKDRVVIRDNQVPTYLAADIAYHKNKFERGFERVINIWGADHHGYIARMKAAVAALGYESANLEVLVLQMVSLYQDGQLVKMSKRTGQGVTLSELIEEVGKDAARFFFIMRSVDSQLDFDLDLAKSRTNENPVYYIQYAHARIASIFRQAKEAGIDLALDFAAADFSLLQEEIEIDLMKKLGQFPAEIKSAALDRAPHRLARYAHDLAALFHSFYNQCRIIGSEPATQAARLALLAATRLIIKKSLAILGVDAPDKM
ncbi:MAG: arginine--tRNA ligase [Sporomusaceae bacterium]|jgi:arginyl-tRNA synthetase|nr:arginine--tRNA ligase [Sporomusaceae bacterium]